LTSTCPFGDLEKTVDTSADTWNILLSNPTRSFFVIFNLYCPNETNDTRLPYKLNFLHHLQARITHLISLGRNVIVLGDINVCHRPLDNGEGGIQRNAEEHFDHPARKWFDAWVSPRGLMHDVTREAWPERKGMFTCESGAWGC